MTAEELVKFMEELCDDHYIHSEGRLVNHDNPEERYGEYYSADKLLADIKFRLSLKSKETKNDTTEA